MSFQEVFSSAAVLPVRHVKMETPNKSMQSSHAIPALIELLSDTTGSGSEEDHHFELEDTLNAEHDHNAGRRNMDNAVASHSQIYANAQEAFDELALQSPRSSSSSQDLGLLNDLCFRNFPRASSSSNFSSSLISLQTQATQPPLSESNDVFEPTRPRQSNVPAPPPKRFYKFWWRGIVRAVYDASRAERMARARSATQESFE